MTKTFHSKILAFIILVSQCRGQGGFGRIEGSKQVRNIDMQVNGGRTFQKVASAKATHGAGNWDRIAHLQLHPDTDDLHLDRDPGTLNLTLNFNTPTLILTLDCP